MRDYEVNTAVLFHTGFNDGECNRLMFEGMKEKSSMTSGVRLRKTEHSPKISPAIWILHFPDTR